MKKDQGYIIEEFFAKLCNGTYLRGFVFHSPKYYDPTEKEAGDVVLWVRTITIVFEIISRNVKEGSNPKNFIQRIGKKRKQLERDFKAFKDPSIKVEMVSQLGEKVDFSHHYFSEEQFLGIILVDSDFELPNLHYKTFEKTLNQDFPISIMSLNDFYYILKEVDTVPDLKYYLWDRFSFIKTNFPEDADYFLNIIDGKEKNLLAAYKTNEYSFPKNWDPQKEYWEEFISKYRDKIEVRDDENRESLIIDDIISKIINKESHKIFAWELAVLTRRARAGMLSSKLNEAFKMLNNGREERKFAIFNQETMCWILFYFQYGGTSSVFKKKVHEYTRLKLIFEINEHQFPFSIFTYGFRKSEIGSVN